MPWWNIEGSIVSLPWGSPPPGFGSLSIRCIFGKQYGGTHVLSSFSATFAKRSRSRLASWGLVQSSPRTDKTKKKKREAKTKKDSIQEPEQLQLRDLCSIKEFSELEYRGVSTRSERYTVDAPKSLSIFLRTRLRRPRLLVRAIRSILDQDLRETQVSMNIILLFSDEVNIDA